MANKKPKYYQDKEAKLHDEYCYVIVIAPNQRTMHSCNCSRSRMYKENFEKYKLSIKSNT